MLLVPLSQTTSTDGLPIGVILLLVVFVAVDLFFFITALRIVPEYQRLVVFRLGRFVKVAGPGLVYLFPFIDAAARVDLRDKVLRPDVQVMQTHDQHAVSVDWLWGYKVIDPARAVLNVQNLDANTQELAQTVLRAILAEMVLYDVMTGRDFIRTALLERLRASTAMWGLQITQVELRDIKRA